MVDLKEPIQNVINQQREAGVFTILDDSDYVVSNIQKIFEVYEKDDGLVQDKSNLPKNGNLIFVAAPTGAGKDTLVRQINQKRTLNGEKKYIELNMDIFRSYYEMYYYDPEKIDKKGYLTEEQKVAQKKFFEDRLQEGKFVIRPEDLNDANFARLTNELSYEIYATVQTILLREFPGTDIIITGTLRDIPWVEETFVRYRSEEVAGITTYNIKMASLAVPENVSAISVIKRYVGSVDAYSKEDDFDKGTVRYTSLEYHDETFSKFPENLKYFEETGLIDSFEVYVRCKDILEPLESSRIYSSDDLSSKYDSATEAVQAIRSNNPKLDINEVVEIVDIINRNMAYMKSQRILKQLILDLAKVANCQALAEKWMQEHGEKVFDEKEPEGEEPGN